MSVKAADKAEVSSIDANWRVLVTRDSDNLVRNFTYAGLQTLIAGVAAPGGSNGQLQVNNNGAFAGLQGSSYSGSDLTLGGNLAVNGAVIGGTASGNNLTLQSTSHATKGKILFGASAYDEVNNRLGLGNVSPSYTLDAFKTVDSDFVARIRNTSTNGTAKGLLIDTDQNSAGNIALEVRSGGVTKLTVTTMGLSIPASDLTMSSGKGVLFDANHGLFAWDGSSVKILSNNDPIRFVGSSEWARFDTSGRFGIGIATLAARLHVVASDAAVKGQILQGVASQSAVLNQLQGVSSTSTVRAQADIDTAWIDSTDATRKARLILRAWDTAGREVARGWGDGSDGRVAVAAPASAPTDAHLAASQISFYLDESGHNLLVRAKYSDRATLKLATIALA